jgi:hypothetical protein
LIVNTVLHVKSLESSVVTELFEKREALKYTLMTNNKSPEDALK